MARRGRGRTPDPAPGGPREPLDAGGLKLLHERVHLAGADAHLKSSQGVAIRKEKRGARHARLGRERAGRRSLCGRGARQVPPPPRRRGAVHDDRVKTDDGLQDGPHQIPPGPPRRQARVVRPQPEHPLREVQLLSDGPREEEVPPLGGEEI